MSPVSLAFDARGLALPPPNAFTFDRQQAALAAVRALNLGIEPVLSRAGYAGIASPLTGPLVTAAPSEIEPLAPEANYVAWLANASLDQIRAGTPPAGGDTLLFALLRHSLLRVYASSGGAHRAREWHRLAGRGTRAGAGRRWPVSVGPPVGPAAGGHRPGRRSRSISTRFAPPGRAGIAGRARRSAS